MAMSSMRCLLIAALFLAAPAFSADPVSTEGKTAAQIQAEFERSKTAEPAKPQQTRKVATAEKPSSHAPTPQDDGIRMDSFGALFIIIIVIGAVFYGARYFGGPIGEARADGPMICPACGTRGTPATATRGSTGIELVLWLCFLVPGLIYSLWRLSSRYKVCPACKQPGMIPVTSPLGKKLSAPSA